MRHLRTWALTGLLTGFVAIAPSYADTFADGERATASGNYARAIELYRASIAQGNMSAEYALAHFYENGQPPFIKMDKVQALAMYKHAAMNGHALAESRLGRIYRLAECGQMKNITESIKWYEMSAAKGEGSAFNDLAIIHASGDGVPLDYVETLKWAGLALIAFRRDHDSEDEPGAQANYDAVAQHATAEQVQQAKNNARDYIITNNIRYK